MTHRSAHAAAAAVVAETGGRPPLPETNWGAAGRIAQIQGAREASRRGTPIDIGELFRPGVYPEIKRVLGEHIAYEQLILAGESQASPPQNRVWGEDSFSELGNACDWDTRSPRDCKPLQPSSAERPIAPRAQAEFFRREGERLAWPDEEMLRQMTGRGGIESRSRCERVVSIQRHHGGLRKRPEAAIASIDADVAVETTWTPFEDVADLRPWGDVGDKRARALADARAARDVHEHQAGLRMLL